MRKETLRQKKAFTRPHKKRKERKEKARENFLEGSLSQNSRNTNGRKHRDVHSGVVWGEGREREALPILVMLFYKRKRDM